MSSNPVHLVANAHMDPVWLWEWEEGVAAALSTFRTAADLCEECDGFIFNHNEAILYQWTEQYEPALFKRIQRLVKAGRWHIMGGWFLQPDCNMPCGEGIVRQVLAGRRYFRDKFGVAPTTAVNMDPFGHSRGLVQILVQGGYDSYMFMRPAQKDCPLPDNVFRWVGFDGSSVIGLRLYHGYNSPLGKARAKVEAHLEKRPVDRPTMLPWGVGNHGGGPSRKDLVDLAGLIAEQAKAGTPVAHSTPERYVRALRASGVDCPAHADALNAWAPGCYTSQVRVKQAYRSLENQLWLTEGLCATAAANGRLDYPAADLESAERDMLFAQFHDILPGSAIRPVEDWSLRLMAHGLETLGRARTRAFYALAAGQPAARPDTQPILVYNPHPWPVETLLACEFQLADINRGESWTVPRVFKGRRALPTSLEKEDSNLNVDWRKRVVFRARLAPGVINRFDCRFQTLPARPVPSLKPVRGRLEFSNGELEVTINTRTGLIDRFVVGGRDVLSPGACRPLVIRDNEDPWGSQVRAFGDVEDRFRLMRREEAARFSDIDDKRLRPVRVIEDGAARVVVEALLTCRDSRVVLRYELPRHGTQVGLHARVLWQEPDRMLKLSLPLPFAAARYLGETVYGIQDVAADGREAVLQSWAAVVGEADDRALGIVNLGTYGSDFRPGELRLTLLRSPAYSALPLGGRPLVRKDRALPRIDMGLREFRFMLSGGPVAERLARLPREARELNLAPVALAFHPAGDGPGDAPQPVAILRDRHVVMTALYRSGDGRGWTVRLFNPSGVKRTARVDFPVFDLSRQVRFNPFEIVTLVLDPARRKIHRTNLLESAETGS